MGAFSPMFTMTRPPRNREFRDWSPLPTCHMPCIAITTWKTGKLHHISVGASTARVEGISRSRIVFKMTLGSIQSSWAKFLWPIGLDTSGVLSQSSPEPSHRGRLYPLPYGIAGVTAVTAVRTQFLSHSKPPKLLPFSQFLPLLSSSLSTLFCFHR